MSPARIGGDIRGDSHWNSNGTHWEINNSIRSTSSAKKEKKRRKTRRIEENRRELRKLVIGQIKK